MMTKTTYFISEEGEQDCVMPTETKELMDG
jgi:hypothetical protein